MAISHVQPLLLLLASLFFLPALYALEFEYCNDNNGYDFGSVTDVAVTYQDDDTPTATIYVSISVGPSIQKTLHGGSVTVDVTTIGENRTMDGRMYYLSEVVDAWPVRANTHVVLDLTKVPLRNYDLESYEKAMVTVYGEDREEELCVNFNLQSSTASAAVSA